MQEESAERESNNNVNLNIVSEASEANYSNANNNSSQNKTNAIRKPSAEQELSDGHKQNKVTFPVIVVTDEGNNMQEKTAERKPNNNVNLNIVSEASEANYPNANNKSSQYNTNAISQLNVK